MPIITKHKDTTGAAVSALETGELGVNTVDGTLSVGSAGGNVVLVSEAQDLPTGTEGQTLRNDSGTWETTDDLMVSSSGVVSAAGGLESEGAGGGSFRAGTSAGVTSQGAFAVAIGTNAGKDTQSNFAVAIGQNAGQTTQGASGVSVGNQAGETTQGTSAVAVGRQAGETSQGANSVALGYSAGNDTQATNSVAVGSEAGSLNQDIRAVAVGFGAGKTTQGAQSVAVGYLAGTDTQSGNAVAVGREAGKTSQGDFGVAMGYLAGATSQGANGIIINSSGVALDDTTAGHIHIASDDGSLDFLSASGWSMSDDLSVTGTVESDNGVSVGATEIGSPTEDIVNSITSVTQAQYDAIVTKDANTFYIITG